MKENIQLEASIKKELISPRSRTVALTLYLLLGLFGAHRFYVGRNGLVILIPLILGLVLIDTSISAQNNDTLGMFVGIGICVIGLGIMFIDIFQIAFGIF